MVATHPFAPASLPEDDAPSASALVEATTPLCLVCDEESSIRHFLSLILQGAGVDTEEFSAGTALRLAIGGKQAAIVFVDVTLDTEDAIQSLGALAQAGFAGAVQLMSSRGGAVLEHVRGIGEEHRLRMLPPLKKPFDAGAVQRVLAALNIGQQPAQAARVRLDEALANGWVEFWLQPRIELRQKQLAGVEAHARVRHPQFGVLGPEAFMPAASASDKLRLAEFAITDALRAQHRLAEIGVPLAVLIEIDASVLQELPAAEIVRAERGDGGHHGLTFALPEAQVASEPALAAALDEKVKPAHIRLALTQVGRSYNELIKAPALPIAEFRLDPVFISDCASDKVNAPVCRNVIDLAHAAGATATADGLARAADILALISMGCDLGQGQLLGQPMLQDRFFSLLRQRTGRSTSVAA